LHTIGDERDMFAGLGWENEIRSLGDPHILFNLSLEFEFVAGNRSIDDYELTPFSRSTQTWRWGVQEEQKPYETNEKRQANVPEKDADLDEDKSNETEQEMKVVGESLKSLSFCKRMRGLSSHRCPLKYRMRDKTISYVDLLRPDPPPLESSKKYSKWK
jgi:hypothetical protein